MTPVTQNNNLTRRAVLSLAVFPALLLALNLFLFGPFFIYVGNITEFDVSLAGLLVCSILPVVVLLSTLCLLAACLPRVLRTIYIAALTAVAILTWIQGNILSWDYGVLGKGAIEWSLYTREHWIDAIAWVALFLILLILHRRIRPFARTGCFLLIVIQTIALITTGMRTPGILKSTTNAMPSREIFEFSSKLNVIHVILDELQSSVFQEIVESDSTLKPSMLGFTSFQNTLGSFPTTVMSIPAIVSTKVYSNSIPIKDFLDNVYPKTTIANCLKDNGFTVDIAVPTGLDWHKTGRWSHFFSIPVPYGVTGAERRRDASRFVRQISLFRASPGFMKRFISSGKIASKPSANNPNERMQWEALRHFSNRDFLQDLTKKMTVTNVAPTYKFVHLSTTHWPAVLNSEGKYAGKILDWTWPNLKTQAKYGVADVLAFFRRLQELGIYDKSLIILQADHGYWKIPDSTNNIQLRNTDIQLHGYAFDNKERFAEMVCSALPLLAIKPPGATAPFSYSTAPATLTDLPATICSILNIPPAFRGRSVFEINAADTRERTFMYYDTLNSAGKDYFDRLEKFTVRGDPLDKSSWQFNTCLSPTNSFSTQQIRLGNVQSQQFLKEGWGHGEAEDQKAPTNVIASGRAQGRRSPNWLRLPKDHPIMRFLIATWGDGEGDGDQEAQTCKASHRWALGRQASLCLSLPKDRPIILTAAVKTFQFQEPQTISVAVDGKNNAVWKLTPIASNWETPWNWDKHSLLIEPDPQRPEVSTIEFTFSQHHRPRAQENDQRPLAVLFQSITLSATTAQALEQYRRNASTRAPYLGSNVVTNSGNNIRTQTIQFGTADATAKNLISGWGDNEQLADEKATANWALGGSAKVSLALPYIRSSKLIARVRPWIFADPQQIEVLVDNASVGQCTLSNAWVWQTCSFDIPANEMRPNVSIVEFRFSHHRTEATRDDPRPLALMFESLRVE